MLYGLEWIACLRVAASRSRSITASCDATPGAANSIMFCSAHASFTRATSSGVNGDFETRIVPIAATSFIVNATLKAVRLELMRMICARVSAMPASPSALAAAALRGAVGEWRKQIPASAHTDDRHALERPSDPIHRVLRSRFPPCLRARGLAVGFDRCRLHDRRRRLVDDDVTAVGPAVD